MPYDGSSNLIRAEDMPEEWRIARARKAGLARAEKERQRKSIQEISKSFLEMEIPPEQKAVRDQLKKFGIANEDMSYAASIVVAMLAKAMRGDVKAAQFLRDSAGFTPKQTLDIEANANIKADIDSCVHIYLPEIENDGVSGVSVNTSVSKENVEVNVGGNVKTASEEVVEEIITDMDVSESAIGGSEEIAEEVVEEIITDVDVSDNG